MRKRRRVVGVTRAGGGARVGLERDAGEAPAGGAGLGPRVRIPCPDRAGPCPRRRSRWAG